MNKEQLSDAIGRVEDPLVVKTVPRRRKRRWWIGAVAAAACIAVAAGAVLLPNRRPAAGLPGSVRMLAMAVYPPELTEPERDDEGNYTDPQAGEDWWDRCWENDRRAVDTVPSLSAYQTAVTRQFLSDRQGENRVISPLNLYMALGMLAECTDGDSRSQLLQLLGTDTVEQLRQRVNALWLAEYRDSRAGICRLANSLWLRQEGSYRQKTLDTLAKDYFASSFSGKMGSDGYNQSLRGWLNQQTSGLLKQAADAVELQERTVIALASTVYFSARWQDEFDRKDTVSDTFHATAGDVICDYLRRENWDTDVYSGEGFRALSLEFGADSCRMWFVLPDEGVSPDTLLASGAWLGNMGEGQTSRVSLRVPKFDVSGDMDLAAGLQALGVTDVFDEERADFSPLSDDGGCLTRIQHAARVMVDEEGCTAAAFTVELKDGSMMPKDPPRVDFHLDRPFLFYITGDTGNVLFSGVVEQPQ